MGAGAYAHMYVESDADFGRLPPVVLYLHFEAGSLTVHRAHPFG